MQKLALVALVIGLSAGIWWVFSRVSPDAVALGLGLLLGVLATLPATALVMADRQRQVHDPAQPVTTVTHQHIHRIDRTQLEAAYREGWQAGRQALITEHRQARHPAITTSR